MNTRKLFAFGDSFTNGFNDLRYSWIRDYIEWKGYKPKNYVDFIGEHYNIEVINNGIQGADNQSIIESFIKNYSQIKPDDIVIINWTDIVRFRIASDDDNEWKTILPNVNYENSKFNISKRTLEEIMVNRTSLKYVEELTYWMEFINYLCKQMKIVQWSLKFSYDLDINIFGSYELITEETKGKVVNGHFSENGNKHLANDIIKIIEK